VSLFDTIIEQQQQTRSRDLCTVAKVRNELAGQDLKDFDRALDEEEGGTWRIKGVVIAESLQKVLGARSHNIKGSTIQRHRRHLCSCPRPEREGADQ
jgi:hypothetical protein